MRVNFDFENNQVVFEHHDHCVYSTLIVSITSQWMSAFIHNVSIGEETYSVAWKTWQKEKQIVEVCKYDARDKVPCQVVATWSYRPESPNRPESTIEHYGLEGNVCVTGSPYGDWCS